MLVNVLLFFGSLVGMEVVAYVMHKYLMHGPLWFLHGSHHRPRAGWFELNDVFGVFFAIPSIFFIYLGTHGYPMLLWVGLGMTAYGFCYFVFHDVIVHRRLPVRIRSRNRYLRRITQAHMIHHCTLERDHAVSFGFLYAPPVETLKRNARG